MASKRGRLLIRQPRVKKESELLHAQYSTPDDVMLAREGFQVTETIQNTHPLKNITYLSCLSLL